MRWVGSFNIISLLDYRSDRMITRWIWSLFLLKLDSLILLSPCWMKMTWPSSLLDWLINWQVSRSRNWHLDNLKAFSHLNASLDFKHSRSFMLDGHLHECKSSISFLLNDSPQNSLIVYNSPFISSCLRNLSFNHLSIDLLGDQLPTTLTSLHLSSFHTSYLDYMPSNLLELVVGFSWDQSSINAAQLPRSLTKLITSSDGIDKGTLMQLPPNIKVLNLMTNFSSSEWVTRAYIHHHHHHLHRLIPTFFCLMIHSGKLLFRNFRK